MTLVRPSIYSSSDFGVWFLPDTGVPVQCEALDPQSPTSNLDNNCFGKRSIVVLLAPLDLTTCLPRTLSLLNAFDHWGLTIQLPTAVHCYGSYFLSFMETTGLK